MGAWLALTRQRSRRRLLNMGQTLLEDSGNFFCGLESRRRGFVVQSADQLFEPFGKIGLDLADRPGRGVADSPEHTQGCLRPKRRAARGLGVEHAAEAEEVRPLVD